MPVLISGMPALVSMIVLAVVQGLTEFLPVSSSGHLALGQMLMGIGQGSLEEDIVLHAGTLIAVMAFYRRDLAQLVRGFFGRPVDLIDGLSARTWVLLLILGNVPAALVGLTLKDQVEVLFDNPVFVLSAMGVTGLMLLSTRLQKPEGVLPGPGRALIIGCAQAMAILPGVSRSGWTLGAALALGLKPEAAVRFSFLLSIPAILGAIVLQLADRSESSTSFGALATGFVVAAVVGIFALRWLVALARRMELHRFAWYLFAVVALGAVILLFGGA